MGCPGGELMIYNTKYPKYGIGIFKELEVLRIINKVMLQYQSKIIQIDEIICGNKNISLVFRFYINEFI